METLTKFTKRGVDRRMRKEALSPLTSLHEMADRVHKKAEKIHRGAPVH